MHLNGCRRFAAAAAADVTANQHDLEPIEPFLGRRLRGAQVGAKGGDGMVVPYVP